MANTEVTVSMGEVVVVKAAEEEGDLDDGSKTQVILQLQPITSGIGDDSGEVDAAVVAVEAQEEASAEGEDVEFGYPITCGESKAVLLFKKFVCPGINVKCVKYDDQLISPKQFVHMSGKATLKDWKRAIRMGGVMLRKMMDSGQIDFYQHSTLCTNTCRSTKFDLLINNTRFPPDSSLLNTPTSTQGLIVMGNGGQVAEERSEDVTVEWSSVAVETTDKKEVQEISEDTLNFWKGIADVGLMGEVVSNIRTELLEMLRGVQLRTDQANLQDAEVAVLSNLAQVFGLLDSIKRILGDRRQQTDPDQEQVLSTLSSLEQQLEEQKKQQAQSWLSQSQALSSVVLSPPPPKRPAKRPRLQRPSSSAAALPGSQPVSLQPQQFTVLSPITLSSVGQPFTVAGLPVATLAQSSSTVTLHTLPGGSQFFARYASADCGTISLHPSSGLTLVGTAALQQDAGGALLGPVELVHLTQAAGLPEDGEAMAGTAVLLQEAVLEEDADDQAAHATVIEIDPAPGEHAVGVVELQLGGEEAAGEEEVEEDEGAITTVVVQGHMVGGEGEEASDMEVQGETEEVQGELEEVQGELEEVQGEELQLESHGQLHSLQIMVIEEETMEESKAK